MVELKEGAKAPNFSLPNANGELVSLSDFKGKNVVLYFYPKDDTSGCTVEACEFTDNLKQFEKIDAIVLGVSADSVESHKKFEQKHKLKVTLLSDEDKKVLQAYGVWQEKSMYGRKFMGIVRTTFIISPDGKIKKVFNRVSPKGHAKEVLEAIKA